MEVHHVTRPRLLFRMIVCFIALLTVPSAFAQSDPADRFKEFDKDSNGKEKADSPASTSQIKKGNRPGGAGEAFEVKGFKGSNGESIAYSLYTPEKTEGKLPLVLCLHGRGGNSQAANVAASPRIQSRNPSFVMAPGVKSKTVKWVAMRGARSAMPELMEAIDDLIKNHPIDPNRIYVTGQSMGGVGTWGIIATHPDKFAAAAPVCGAWREEYAAEIKDIPLWAFHGDQDSTVPVSGSRKMIAALKAAGGNPKYTEYPGVGHDSWTKAYATDEFWVWLFKQSK